LRTENEKLQTRLEYVEERMWQMTTRVLDGGGRAEGSDGPNDNKVDGDSSSRESTVTPSLSTFSATSGETGEDPAERLPSHPRRRLPALPQRKTDPHPPGFRALTNRIDKFSGRQAEDNFEVWLQDYVEATEDCGWDDEKRARWFSWFLAGPAKATWQQTVLAEHKTDWSKITEVYRGQYGVHLDPRTAYQRCHELQYEQFGSVQGLLNSMREYQRMAPLKLTNEVLESILWNKVPVELQKEVKEITTDGSVQQLLHKLLRAEAVIQERERRTHTKSTIVKKPANSLLSGKGHSVPTHSRQSTGSNHQGDSQRSDKLRDKPTVGSGAEMSARGPKCFKCQKKGHFAKECPEAKHKDPSRRVAESNAISDDVEDKEVEVTEQSSEPDPWLRTVTTDHISGDTDQLEPSQVATRGPTYKVDLTVDGVCTRGLLDHGAQVSLVRKELLPVIKDHQGWTKDDTTTRNLKMEAQPIGAEGGPLGATALVKLLVQVDETGKAECVPFYVLESKKPIWQGELSNCGMVLGTNALISLGFVVAHANGTVIEPTGDMKRGSVTRVYQVVLTKDLHVGPFQTRPTPVCVDGDPGTTMGRGLVSPREQPMAELQCDFTDELWTGEQSLSLSVTNWSGQPVLIKKGTAVGTLEPVSQISREDPLWEEQSGPVVATVSGGEDSCQRRDLLEEQLCIGEHCSTEDRAALTGVVLANHHSFALSDDELGETNLVEHVVQLTDHTPIATQPRRLPYALRKELEGELDRLVGTGCIEPSNSPYASGLVLVRKKDRSLRVCVDYRGINKLTVPDKYPMPRIDELLDRVGECKGRYFTCLDLMKGYHQVKVAEESKPRTAFTCHMGLFQYRRMPFGLTNAPATFQRLMSRLFAGKEWNFVFIYLDDLLIVSKSITEHVEHIERVLRRLGEANLRLKPQKCKFAQQEVEYLGHTLTSEGVRPNDSKTRAVKEFPRPTTVKEVKSFLGLVNYYRRHLKNLAIIARPLTALTRKGLVKLDWTTECEEAFQEVKRMLCTAPMLRPPDMAKEFFLSTDASMRGFGALLEQEGDDKRRYPIAYASRQTNSAEVKYAPTELEVAALVFAVEHFEVYLLGSKVTVFTDHQALVSPFISHLQSQTRGLLARWYLRLSRFLPNLKLEYKPGHQNTAADALSRAPVDTSPVLAVTVDEDSDGSVEPVLGKVQAEQRRDPELTKMMNYLERKELPEDSREANQTIKASQNHFMVNGVLYFEPAESQGGGE